MVKTKVCSKCRKEKDIGGFHKDKSKKNGLQYTCKECRKIYYEQNIEKILEQHKKYNGRPEIKEKIKEYNKEYYSIPENREKIREQQRQRRKENPLLATQASFLSSIYSAIKIGKCSKRILKILGCSQGEFNNHFANLLRQSCPLCGKDLTDDRQLDHIYPKSKAQNYDDFFLLNRLENLQLLCLPCNLRKGNKIPPIFPEYLNEFHKKNLDNLE